MRYIALTSLLFVLFVLLQCGQISSGEDDSSFLFSVKVSNPSNRPLSGLYVHAWNHIQFSGFKNRKALARPSLASTTIMFDLIDDTRVNLILKNLRDETVLEIFRQELFNNGRYSITPEIQSQNALDIYKCHFEVRDLKQHLLYFTDSTYLVLYQPLVPFTELGETDNQGMVSITDSLKFPSVLKNLPELVSTDHFSPVPQGKIEIEDSITIVVWDPQNLLYQRYYHEIHPAKNHFKLVWNNPTSMTDLNESISFKQALPEYLLEHEGVEIFQDRLYQNYPNPFN